jgi:hypothetical protein
LRADVDLPYRAIQSEIGSLVDLVIDIERQDGRRLLSQVLFINGYDAESNHYNTRILYHS